MRRGGTDAESPLVVGDDAVAEFDAPPTSGGDVVEASGQAWWIVGLGLGLVALAVIGLALRPASTPGTVELPLVPSADATAVSAASAVDDREGRAAADEPEGTARLAAGPRQTVTVWSLPEGVFTWWPLGSHVVFVSAGTALVEPRVYAHDKLSGRAVWAATVAAGTEVVVTDPASDDSVRFVAPGEAQPDADPGARAPAGTGDGHPLVLSVDDGSVLQAPR